MAEEWKILGPDMTTVCTYEICDKERIVLLSSWNLKASKNSKLISSAQKHLRVRFKEAATQHAADFQMKIS